MATRDGVDRTDNQLEWNLRCLERPHPSFAMFNAFWDVMDELMHDSLAMPQTQHIPHGIERFGVQRILLPEYGTHALRELFLVRQQRYQRPNRREQERLKTHTPVRFREETVVEQTDTSECWPAGSFDIAGNQFLRNCVAVVMCQDMEFADAARCEKPVVNIGLVFDRVRVITRLG